MSLPVRPIPAGFTERELMVVAAGREIRDGEVVFVGMRLPLIAFAFAKRTHAPGALGFFENGIVRDRPAPATLMTMSDTPNLPGAVWSTGTREIMGLLLRVWGRLNRGDEIDRHGNLNTNYVGDCDGTKLPARAAAAHCEPFRSGSSSSAPGKHAPRARGNHHLAD